jgi:hypothetical protein
VGHAIAAVYAGGGGSEWAADTASSIDSSPCGFFLGKSHRTWLSSASAEISVVYGTAKNKAFELVYNKDREREW